MEGARHTLVVMTYTLGHESRAILETAYQRQCDGVRLTVVMEDSPTNHDAFERNWPDPADPPRILVPNRAVWPTGILHGKVICADETDLFVSSANLTGRAVDHNLEVGVKLGAPHAREFMRYLRDWSEARLLVPSPR
jgi:phosphatidylserine/phosphatidylglycerophosphate/cardiolipin synthase-like enzyme